MQLGTGVDSDAEQVHYASYVESEESGPRDKLGSGWQSKGAHGPGSAARALGAVEGSESWGGARGMQTQFAVAARRFAPAPRRRAHGPGGMHERDGHFRLAGSA